MHWGPFLEGPERFSHPENRSEISNLMITELFYSHFLNGIGGSIPYKSIHLSGCKYQLAKNGFSGVSGIFEGAYYAISVKRPDEITSHNRIESKRIKIIFGADCLHANISGSISTHIHSNNFFSYLVMR